MVLLALAACQVDPLALAGIAPEPPPPLPQVLAEEPILVEPGPEGGAAPEPRAFDPVSVPEGPRDDGGVKWKGVSGKFTPPTQEDRDMFVGEDP